MIPKDRLDSWKEIADYLNRDVRTAIRWEKKRGLPVHRIPGQKRASVYALPAEIDAWLRLDAATSALDAPSGSSVPGSPPVLAQHAPFALRKFWMLAFAATLLLGIASWSLRSWPRLEDPQLDNAVQLTSDGRDKERVVRGGSSVFFSSTSEGRTTVTRIYPDGTQSLVPTPGLTRLDLQDASADGSRLLLIENDARSMMWVVPTGGNPPKPLGARADTAAWSPDGSRLAYYWASDLFMASADGSHARRLCSLPAECASLRWSPDGKRLRFSLGGRRVPERLAEISADGQGLRSLLPGWSSAPGDREDAGRWTPDGRFYLFTARHQGVENTWALREDAGWLNWADRGPFQLTSGMEAAYLPTPSQDGKRLFAKIQGPARGELMQYDRASGNFVLDPDLGTSIGHISFTRDGRRAAYIAYPEMTLWTMDAGGVNRRQLTSSELLAAMPQWSPDGRSIAFMGSSKGSHEPTTIHILSSTGGPPEEPVRSPEWQGVPSWTADGSGLIFGENGPNFPIAPTCALHRFDFRTGDTLELPGSTGLWSARACPTGRYVAAITRDNRTLVLYDLQTSTWVELVTFKDSVIGDNPSWSRDGKFIYVDAPKSLDPAIYRIWVADKHRERVAGLKGLPRVRGGMGLWIGLTPQDVPLLLRESQSEEIFAMDWLAP